METAGLGSAAGTSGCGRPSEPRQTLWFSSYRMTVVVDVEDDLIAEAAPIVRCFVGQPVKNLRRWMKRQGGFMKEVLRGC